MVQVVFYEKPGCINNTRQKKILRDAGHVVIANNLLETNWQADQLRKFFSDLPVHEWFNRSAPAVKNGEIIPEDLTEKEALSYMVKEPLLIRRPLIEVEGTRVSGFNFTEIDEWIGLRGEVTDDLESCPRTHNDMNKCN